MSDETKISTGIDADKGIEELASSLCTLICEAQNSIVDLLSNEQIETALTTLGDISQNLLDTISTIKMLRKVASIPTKLFMSKYERYAKGLVAIPYNKRQKYLKKVGNHGLNKDSVFILNVLNKIEELSKIDMLLALFEVKMDERLDENSYRRLMIMVDRTMYSDLLFLNKEIKEGDFTIECEEEEALLSNGFILFSGIGWGTATEESGNLYHYTNVARKFCQIVFNFEVIPKLENSFSVLNPRPLTKEEIDEIVTDAFSDGKIVSDGGTF